MGVLLRALMSSRRLLGVKMWDEPVIKVKKTQLLDATFEHTILFTIQLLPEGAVKHQKLKTVLHLCKPGLMLTYDDLTGLD